jgi:hypothetical protein
MTTLITTAPDMIRDIHTDVPWGVIAPSIVAGLLGIMYFILILIGKAPGIRWQSKAGKVEVSSAEDRKAGEKGVYVGPERRCIELDIKPIQMVQIVSRHRFDSINTTWARQTAAINSTVEDLFIPILAGVCTDRRQVSAAWERYATVLRDVANFNHILDEVYRQVNGERYLNPDYLNDKVAIYRIRYEKMLAWPGNKLPAFKRLEDQIRGLTAEVLERFHEIAQEEERKLMAFVEEFKQTTDNVEIRTILDKVAQRQIDDIPASLTGLPMQA